MSSLPLETEQQAFQLLIQTVRVFEATRYCQVVAVVVTIYDHVLSFGDEIRLIWGRPFSPVTFFYFLVRYLGDAVLVLNVLSYVTTTFSVDACKILQLAAIYGTFACVWSTQLVMQFRLYAMYGNSWRIFVFTFILYVAEVAGMSTVFAMYLRRTTYENEPLAPALNSWHMCSMPGPVKSITAVYVPIFCYEVVMLVLALFAVFQRLGGIGKESRLNRLHATVNMLFRHSVAYFLVYVIACAVATGMYLGLPPDYINLLDVFLMTASVLLGSHLVLSARNFNSTTFEVGPPGTNGRMLNSSQLPSTSIVRDQFEMIILPGSPRHSSSPSRSSYGGTAVPSSRASFPPSLRASHFSTFSGSCVLVAQSPSQYPMEPSRRGPSPVGH